MTRWQWFLRRLTHKLWVRASLIGMLGVAAAVLSAVVERYLPWELPAIIGVEAVDGILTIIASSMLAVTTFSLSIMVAAYGSATSNVTPRATPLLMEDTFTQNVLSTFLGSFLFSIVGLVVLQTGAYGERGRLILFVVTIGVIALIVVSLLRWIDHLTGLGRVGQTIQRVEHAAQAAIQARLERPYLGGQRLEDVPDAARAVIAERVGYVQHIDIEALHECCEEVDGQVYLAINPGAFIYPGQALAWMAAAADPARQEALEGAVRDAFSMGDERSFEQDPRFGLAVMSEIGSRALSPATNDPGTAIDVIGRSLRLMTLWAQGCDPDAQQQMSYPRVHVPPLQSADLFEDAFMLMARDGAGLIEVQAKLQKALHALSRLGDGDFRAAALAQAQLAQSRAEAALSLPADLQRLHAVIDKARQQGGAAG